MLWSLICNATLLTNHFKIPISNGIDEKGTVETIKTTIRASNYDCTEQHVCLIVRNRVISTHIKKRCLSSWFAQGWKSTIWFLIFSYPSKFNNILTNSKSHKKGANSEHNNCVKTEIINSNNAKNQPDDTIELAT